MPTCCPPPSGTPRHTWPRRMVSLLQWALPSLLLALMPKCPFCITGYIALWTGLGISLTGAHYLRFSLITLCILSLCLLIASRVRRHILHPTRI